MKPKVLASVAVELMFFLFFLSCFGFLETTSLWVLEPPLMSPLITVALFTQAFYLHRRLDIACQYIYGGPSPKMEAIIEEGPLKIESCLGKLA